ncbi:VOC family protein [Catellatospora sp. KI3]|uniref:VOC family protein n=1 Tax=Catellatospora sp. KI3 TaxID=3041620 RepID=UPI002482C96A|nr:VOC family protein [Catellatospora sp. KI3]MDI1464034.1 VOC family protein [Catellatospora sp. KI3]
MARIRSVVLHVGDIPRAAAFWTRALGYEAAPDNPAFLSPTDGDGPALHLDEDDRTHLDLEVADAQEQRAEVERLISLGATKVEWDYPDDADFVVFADTEGNLFCVVDTSA